jgi:hypothetical protein
MSSGNTGDCHQRCHSRQRRRVTDYSSLPLRRLRSGPVPDTTKRRLNRVPFGWCIAPTPYSIDGLMFKSGTDAFRRAICYVCRPPVTTAVTHSGPTRGATVYSSVRPP